MTGPGSLTVTRPTRVVGAGEEYGVGATGREDLSEARAVNSGSAEGEIGVAGIQTTPGIYSGHGRQRYVIVVHTIRVSWSLYPHMFAIYADTAVMEVPSV